MVSISKLEGVRGALDVVKSGAVMGDKSVGCKLFVHVSYILSK